MSFFSKLFSKKEVPKPLLDQVKDLFRDEYRIFFIQKATLADKALPLKKRMQALHILLDPLHKNKILERIEKADISISQYYEQLSYFNASLSLILTELARLKGTKKSEDIEEIEGNIAAHMTTGEQMIIELYKKMGLSSIPPPSSSPPTAAPLASPAPPAPSKPA